VTRDIRDISLSYIYLLYTHQCNAQNTDLYKPADRIFRFTTVLIMPV